MRTLPDVAPTDEQLAILSVNRPGVELIRGAAGSGKTTTALLRLRSLIGVFINQRRRQESSDEIRVLVLTYNRTLRGYVEQLARHQMADTPQINLEISTFGKWARESLHSPPIVPDDRRRALITRFSRALPLDPNFLAGEAEYAMGRFLPDDLSVYLLARRDGRGTTPRMERPVRQRLLDEVIAPYHAWKARTGLLDWNDLAVLLTMQKLPVPLDVVIIDEAQDFSANQIRAVINQLQPVHALTFVMDSVQRIYASGFTWVEIGITIPPNRNRRLSRNYRNTVEIARLAQGLVRDLPLDDDGTIPDFSKCSFHGPLPEILVGTYSKQTAYAIAWVQHNVPLDRESIAFLHPLGGRWFDYLRWKLRESNLVFVELSREDEWPDGPENIGLSTLHSSKGLEFDHVIVLGLNAEVLPHGEGEEDDKLTMLRRLLAMGIGRARKTVMLGYKPDEASDLVKYFDPSTFVESKL